ncbi:MAG: hypothetical protein WBQ26_02675 [Gemmatimonadaceae bacterium]
MNESSTPTSVTPVPSPAARREFLGQLATIAAAFAVTACANGGFGAGAAAPAPAMPGDNEAMLPPLPPLEFDDTWASRIAGRYKAVFDSPAIDEGTGVFNALIFMKGFKDMYKLSDSDVSAVLVMRHRAIPMAVDDTIWARYALGEYSKVKDSGTGKWATRNPFWKAAPGDTTEDADYTLDALNQRGGVLLGCAMATHGLASILAKRTQQKDNVVFDELRRHLIPGVQLAPSGIFAVMRAQDAGCHYMRST